MITRFVRILTFDPHLSGSCDLWGPWAVFYCRFRHPMFGCRTFLQHPSLLSWWSRGSITKLTRNLQKLLKWELWCPFVWLLLMIHGIHHKTYSNRWNGSCDVPFLVCLRIVSFSFSASSNNCLFSGKSWFVYTVFDYSIWSLYYNVVL